MCWSVDAIVDVLAKAAQIFGIPFAVITIIMARREARKGRDLQISLQLIEHFGKSWEQKWRSLLNDKLTGNDKEEETLNFLNWVNWLGMLIRKKYVHDEKLILEDLGHPLKKGLIMFQRKIEIDLSDRNKGLRYWGGVLVVANKLSIEIKPRSES